MTKELADFNECRAVLDAIIVSFTAPEKSMLFCLCHSLFAVSSRVKAD